MHYAKTVEEAIETSKWKAELETLRSLMLETELEECVKWGAPYYTLKGKNVAAFIGFKEHFALWFTNGVFMSDPHKKLINAQEGTTKGLRQWRFAHANEIDEDLIREYLLEAIENQKKGLEIKAEPKQVSMPIELENALDNDATLTEAFKKLTPGKRKEYAEYIGSAKQEATRLKRLAKCEPMIREGKGLNDKYR